MIVSVVIPVYNAARYLRACLCSVLEQTLRDIEVICVDDGSTDGSAAILAEFAAKDERVRVLTQANAGQGAARNRGLEVAKGEFVYFMDADDELACADALERLVGEMESERLDLLFFDAETRFDDIGGQSRAVKASDYIRTRDYSRVRPGMEMYADMCRHADYVVGPPLALFRRALLSGEEVRFPEGIIYEDNIFMLRALLAAGRVSHRPWRLYLRYVRVGSTVTSPVTLRNLRGYLACWRFGRRLLSDGGPKGRGVRRALSDRTFRHKWQVRRMARMLGGDVEGLVAQLPSDEGAALREAMRCSLAEKVVNAAQCLRDNGFAYTLRRMLFGRPPAAPSALEKPSAQGAKVSIVVPVYNAGKYLRPCLDSIANQTFRNVEVICVDDGSTDDSTAILSEYASRDRRFTVVRQVNQGAAVARNAGMDRVTGDWLLVFDADDVLHEKALEVAVARGTRENADVVLVGHRTFDDSTPPPSLGGEIRWRTVGRDADLFRLARGWAWDKLWRTDLVREGGFRFQPLPIANDLLFTYGALSAAERIVVTATPFVAHRAHPGSIETTRDRCPLAPIEAVRALYAKIGAARGFARWMPDFLFWHANRMKARADSRALVRATRALRRELGVRLTCKWVWEEAKHFVRILLGKAGAK